MEKDFTKSTHTHTHTQILQTNWTLKLLFIRADGRQIDVWGPLTVIRAVHSLWMEGGEVGVGVLRQLPRLYRLQLPPPSTLPLHPAPSAHGKENHTLQICPP